MTRITVAPQGVASDVLTLTIMREQREPCERAKVASLAAGVLHYSMTRIQFGKLTALGGIMASVCYVLHECVLSNVAEDDTEAIRALTDAAKQMLEIADAALGKSSPAAREYVGLSNDE